MPENAAPTVGDLIDALERLGRDLPVWVGESNLLYRVDLCTATTILGAGVVIQRGDRAP